MFPGLNKFAYTNQEQIFKGQVAWISEKQRLPVKTSGKANFYGEKLHCGRFYDRRERDYVIYVHIYVNLDGRGYRFAEKKEKKLVALLLEIEATCPLMQSSLHDDK